jgi:hypothetical protein
MYEKCLNIISKDEESSKKMRKREAFGLLEKAVREDELEATRIEKK